MAVLNTVWEANTVSMQEALSHADLVYVRDSLSRDALPTHFAVKTTPDMSIPMFRKVAREGEFPEPQYDIAVMDCVVPASAETLLRFAEEEKLPYFVMPGHRLHVIREAIAERSGKIRPRLLQITDVMNARGWVTGRFHGLIAALSAGIPVCALPSNTSKIEGLLKDAGLGEICLLSQDWNSETNQRKRDEVERRFEMQKSPEFVQRREAYLEMAVREIDEMFATASALAICQSPHPIG